MSDVGSTGILKPYQLQRPIPNYFQKEKTVRKNKYVTGKVMTIGGPVLIAITFAESLEHRRMAQLFYEKAQSAGFYSIDNEGNVQVSGDSAALGIACRPGFDERLISSAIFGTF